MNPLSRPHVARRRAGFTLLELLVSIGVIAILMALLLPAVQMARESARRTQCRNNLKQIGVAAQLHHDAHGHFPTDGWGNAWVGDADRGFAEDQPGGWIFNSLPYLEQESLRKLAAGTTGIERRRATTAMIRQPVAVFHCPSRRSGQPYPYTSSVVMRNADPVDCNKSDYAINGGDVRINAGSGPVSTAPADLAAYVWPDLDGFNGISFVRSTIQFRDVRDGSSHTILVGEKFLSQKEYRTGRSSGDDQSMLMGDDADIRRWTVTSPLPDSLPIDGKEEFGSAHAGGCHFVLCDGSVRSISYDVDFQVFQNLGNRQDAEALGSDSF